MQKTDKRIWHHLATGSAFGAISFGITLFVDYVFLNILLTTPQTKLVWIPLFPIVPGIACGMCVGMLRCPWLVIATVFLTFLLLTFGSLVFLPSRLVDGTMFSLAGRDVFTFSVVGVTFYWVTSRFCSRKPEETGTVIIVLAGAPPCDRDSRDS